jgi:hypothetical protein
MQFIEPIPPNLFDSMSLSYSIFGNKTIAARWHDSGEKMKNAWCVRSHAIACFLLAQYMGKELHATSFRV